MFDQDKLSRFVIIFVIILLLGVLGYVIYRLYAAREAQIEVQETPIPVQGGIGSFATQTPLPSPTQEISPTAGLETEVEKKRLNQLADFSVVSPTIERKSDRALYYQKEGGDMHASDLVGSSRNKISNITIIGLVEAVWSPAGDRSIVMYLDDETMKSFLHIGTSTVVNLPHNIKSASWSPDGKEFAYLIEEAGNMSLVIADKTGKNKKIIYRTPLLDIYITWVTSDKIAFITAPSGRAEGFLFAYSRSRGTLTRVLGPMHGLQALWSSDGSKILVSSTNSIGQNLQTRIYDSSGKALITLAGKTMPEKCVWATNNGIYCALMKDIPQDTVFPDTYLKGEYNSQDQLVFIDVRENEFIYIINEGAFDMATLSLSQKKDYIIFTNRYDGTLWSYRLSDDIPLATPMPQ